MKYVHKKSLFQVSSTFLYFHDCFSEQCILYVIVHLNHVELYTHLCLTVRCYYILVTRMIITGEKICQYCTVIMQECGYIVMTKF